MITIVQFSSSICRLYCWYFLSGTLNRNTGCQEFTADRLATVDYIEKLIRPKGNTESGDGTK